MDAEIKSVYDQAPIAIQNQLMQLRKWIFEVARECEVEIGRLDEVLKWGVPGYLPRQKNRGTTIRIEWNEEKEASREANQRMHSIGSPLPSLNIT